MRILILGGTRFVGRHLVSSALARDHDVTLFNRGVSNPHLFPEATHLRGDRSASELDALARGEWDAVVDTSGLVPRVAGEAARLLAGRAGTYAYVSSVSAYADLTRSGTTETAGLSVAADPAEESVTLKNYGGLKAGAEAEVLAAWPDRHVIVRAGSMTGPYDDSDRFLYWVRRMALGGRVLGPARANQPVQLLHARDHADFLIGLLESGASGIFNAAGTTTTFEVMLQTCASVAGVAARVSWAPQEFLDRHSIRFPLEVRADEHRDGTFGIDSSRAVQHGLVNRSLVNTVQSIRRWDSNRQAQALRVARGLSAQTEARLLAELSRAGSPPGGDRRSPAPEPTDLPRGADPVADMDAANRQVGASDGTAGRVVRRTPVSPLGLDIGTEPAGQSPETEAWSRQAGRARSVTACCLVATTPRTGSWLLSDLLDSTGLAGQPQEFFRPDFVRTFSRRLGLRGRQIDADYVSAILASASPVTGVFSAKLQPYDFRLLIDALRARAAQPVDGQEAEMVASWLPNPRYVHLTRRDRPRQAISWYRALMSNVWWQFSDDEGKSWDGWPDFLQVRWLEDMIGEDDAAWLNFFRTSGIEPLELVYEDLTAEPDVHVRRVLSYIGIDVPADFQLAETRLRRMASSDNDVWLAAYLVLRESLPSKPEGWYWSLEEGAFVPPQTNNPEPT